MPIEVVSFGPDDIKKVNDFFNFSKKIYEDDPYYVSPMKMDYIDQPLLGAKGLLCKGHPFHNHSEVQYFMLKDDKAYLARIACIIDRNYNDYHKTNVGAFGFFEVIEDYDIAKAVLDTAINWFKDKNVDDVLGPLNFSSNYTVGLLIEGFDNIPFMDTPYNKSYYERFLDQYGFKKAKDVLAQIMPVKQTEETKKRHERLDKVVVRTKKNKNITTRKLDLKKGFKEDLKLIRNIYIDAWSDNWGFVPITEDEFNHSAENMKLVADDGLFRFAYVNGEAAGFIGSLPDVNEMIGTYQNNKRDWDLIKIANVLTKRRKTKRVRLFLFGIRKKFQKMGIDAVLYHESFKHAHEQGQYEECEISWLLEDNILVLRAGESMGGKLYKRWRIYSYDLKEK